MISASQGRIAVITPNGFERSPNPSSQLAEGPGGAVRGGGLRQTLWSPPATVGPLQPLAWAVGTVVWGPQSCCLAAGEMWDVLELQHGGEGPATPSLHRPRVSTAVSGWALGR